MSISEKIALMEVILSCVSYGVLTKEEAREYVIRLLIGI
jgi:hypothetical protein